MSIISAVIQWIDLSTEIFAWKKARKGKEVRDANVSAFEKIQTVVNDTIDGVNQAVRDVQSASDDVVMVAKAAADTVDRANNTIDHADDILVDATAQAGDAADSAILSQSWTGGGTGTRPGEDTNNSEYHSNRSSAEADRSKGEADRASMYANFVTPVFIMANNRVYINQKSTADFKIFKNRMYMKLPA